MPSRCPLPCRDRQPWVGYRRRSGWSKVQVESSVSFSSSVSVYGYIYFDAYFCSGMQVSDSGLRCLLDQGCQGCRGYRLGHALVVASECTDHHLLCIQRPTAVSRSTVEVSEYVEYGKSSYSEGYPYLICIQYLRVLFQGGV
jgi:hypothetical protein